MRKKGFDHGSKVDYREGLEEHRIFKSSFVDQQRQRGEAEDKHRERMRRKDGRRRDHKMLHQDQGQDEGLGAGRMGEGTRDPIGDPSESHCPASILSRIELMRVSNMRSTFDPVFELVSKNKSPASLQYSCT